jgi:general secretion pathway protein J
MKPYPSHPHRDMPCSLPHRQQQGFTLLELIIAIAIFAVVSILTYSGLSSVIQTSQVTEESADKLRQLQLAMIFVRRDIMQIVPRQVNDGSGQLQEAFISSLGESLLEFTRDGNPNPANRVRSTLQRVRYIIEEEQWFRLSWNNLDHTQNEEPQKQLLLDNVVALEFRFLNSQKQWQDTWQKENIAGRSIELPLAIEMNFEHQDWGKIQSIFHISS